MADLLLPDPSLPAQRRVSRLLDFSDRPLPVATVALLLDMDPERAARVLDALRRYGEVEMVALRRTAFYGRGKDG